LVATQKSRFDPDAAWRTSPNDDGLRVAAIDRGRAARSDDPQVVVSADSVHPLLSIELISRLPD